MCNCEEKTFYFFFEFSFVLVKIKMPASIKNGKTNKEEEG